MQEDTKDQGWWFWPEPIRKRDPAAVAEATKRHEENINRFIAQQFLFDRQWKAVKVTFLSDVLHQIRFVSDVAVYIGDLPCAKAHPCFASCHAVLHLVCCFPL